MSLDDAPGSVWRRWRWPASYIIVMFSLSKFYFSETPTMMASNNNGNMTTVVPHSQDVTAPCTSQSQPPTPLSSSSSSSNANNNNNNNNFRSSPFLDSGGVKTIATPGPGPAGAAFAPATANPANGRPPMSNAQTPPYHHNHFRQQQPQQQDTAAVAVRGKTDPAMAPYMCAKCNKKIVDRYLLEALDKYWHEDCLKVCFF